MPFLETVTVFRHLSRDFIFSFPWENQKTTLGLLVLYVQPIAHYDLKQKCVSKKKNCGQDFCPFSALST